MRLSMIVCLLEKRFGDSWGTLLSIMNTSKSLYCCSLILALSVASHAAEKGKTLIDFFLPFEAENALVSQGIWGDSSILPRDPNNGLEDQTLENWCYWDGSIVKDDDGRYHMYASRWSQTLSHSKGWHVGTAGTHAVSDNLWGPYQDLGLMWPEWKDGFGHNIVGLRMHDGRYAVINSEVVPGQVFVSDGPNGPFELLGDLKLDANGFYPGWGRYNELDDGAVRAGVVGHLSNVMILLRPDNRYMMVARHCVPMISDDGILGPYKMYSDKAWRGVDGIPQFKMEDPTVWYSDGLYHIVVNHHGTDTTYHLTSEDGLHNWKNRGLAFHKEMGIFRHKDGTREDWATVQRPTVFTEDESVKAFNFSVIDVHKGKDHSNDENGSKVLVVPFDGEGFSSHIKRVVHEENALIDGTPAPTPWNSLDIGKVVEPGNTGFDAVDNTLRVKVSGKRIEGESDAVRYVYKKMSGDVSAKVMVLSHEISPAQALGGIMFREKLETDSPFVMASISRSGDFRFSEREKGEDRPGVITSAALAAPYWIRLEKRGNKISCFTSPSNRMNWEKRGEVLIDLGETFYVGMAASSEEDQEQALIRFKNWDFHSYGHPKRDGIVRHSFPDTIPVSGEITFEVEVETVQSLDIWVELQNVQTLEKLPVVRKRMWKSGTLKLTYNACEKLVPGADYWFVIKAIPMHFHDSEHIHSGFKKVSVEQ